MTQSISSRCLEFSSSMIITLLVLYHNVVASILPLPSVIPVGHEIIQEIHSVGPITPVPFMVAGTPPDVPEWRDVPEAVILSPQPVREQMIAILGKDWVTWSKSCARLAWVTPDEVYLKVYPQFSKLILNERGTRRWIGGAELKHEATSETRVLYTPEGRAYEISGTFCVRTPTAAAEVDYVLRLRPTALPEDNFHTLPTAGYIFWSEVRELDPQQVPVEGLSGRPQPTHRLTHSTDSSGRRLPNE